MIPKFRTRVVIFSAPQRTFDGYKNIKACTAQFTLLLSILLWCREAEFQWETWIRRNKHTHCNGISRYLLPTGWVDEHEEAHETHNRIVCMWWGLHTILLANASKTYKTTTVFITSTREIHNINIHVHAPASSLTVTGIFPLIFRREISYQFNQCRCSSFLGGKSNSLVQERIGQVAIKGSRCACESTLLVYTVNTFINDIAIPPSLV